VQATRQRKDKGQGKDMEIVMQQRWLPTHSGRMITRPRPVATRRKKSDFGGETYSGADGTYPTSVRGEHLTPVFYTAPAPSGLSLASLSECPPKLLRLVMDVRLRSWAVTVVYASCSTPLSGIGMGAVPRVSELDIVQPMLWEVIYDCG